MLENFSQLLPVEDLNLTYESAKNLVDAYGNYNDALDLVISHVVDFNKNGDTQKLINWLGIASAIQELSDLSDGRIILN